MLLTPWRPRQTGRRCARGYQCRGCASRAMFVANFRQVVENKQNCCIEKRIRSTRKASCCRAAANCSLFDVRGRPTECSRSMMLSLTKH
jgi:hypothetical protein